MKAVPASTVRASRCGAARSAAVVRITVASRHPELKAAVALPVHRWSGIGDALDHWPPGRPSLVARDFVSIVRRRPPVMIPLAGPPGSLALMNAADALPGYQALLPKNSTFQRVAARVAPTIGIGRPNPRLQSFCASDTPIRSPPERNRRCARIPPRRDQHYSARHFRVLGDAFEQLVSDQTAQVPDLTHGR